MEDGVTKRGKRRKGEGGSPSSPPIASASPGSPVQEVSGSVSSYHNNSGTTTTTLNPLAKHQHQQVVQGGKVLPRPELISKVAEMEENRARRAMLSNWITLTTGHRLDTGSDKVRLAGPRAPPCNATAHPHQDVSHMPSRTSFFFFNSFFHSKKH